MAKADVASYTDIVYDVLQSAESPLTFAEIFDAVGKRRPITTRNPKGTIRNALSQARLLVNLGDGRYGYLPHLLRGSVLRLPLTEKKPANHPLVWTDEVRGALWPSFFETQKRSNRQPIPARLPNGAELSLPLEFLGPSRWGSSMPEPLRRYLVENFAAEGDSLILHFPKGAGQPVEMTFEPKRKRPQAAVSERDRQLADAVYQIMRHSGAVERPIWDLVELLLARGLYQSPVPPDAIENILRADARFVPTGFVFWSLAENVGPDLRAVIEDRARFGDLFGLGGAEESEANLIDAAALSTQRRVMERAMADIAALAEQQQFASADDLNAFIQDLLAGGGVPHREAESPLDKAQDLMYDAWQATSPKERIRLAQKALEISPDCADAYVLLAEQTARTPGKAADLYRKGVEAGERALGEEAFHDNVGHFWGITETRPYMRSRLGLAQVARLFELYPEDAAAMWNYARALHAFATEGDTERSRESRATARQQNPHVPEYLLGKKRVPPQLPEYVGWGDRNEAIYATVQQLDAWQQVPGALAWLAR